jgi:DNA-binding transcriptional regulator GbsR (MarR family)
MEKNIEKVRDRFIEMLGNIGESLGLNRTVCQIYALLYISPDPLSPAEIGRLLGASRGNISINMKKLEEWNAVKKVWKKGYVRSFYKANQDIESIVVEKLKTGLEKRTVTMRESLAELKSSIKSSSKAEATKTDKQRKHILDSISKVEDFLKYSDLFIENIDLLKSFFKK